MHHTPRAALHPHLIQAAAYHPPRVYLYIPLIHIPPTAPFIVTAYTVDRYQVTARLRRVIGLTRPTWLAGESQLARARRGSISADRLAARWRAELISRGVPPSSLYICIYTPTCIYTRACDRPLKRLQRTFTQGGPPVISCAYAALVYRRCMHFWASLRAAVRSLDGGFDGNLAWHYGRCKGRDG